MKKHFLINTAIVVLFFLFDWILARAVAWANANNLGAEVALGMAIPALFFLFVLAFLCSIVFSLYKSIRTKSLKCCLPILVFVVGIVVFALVRYPDSIWHRLIGWIVE